MLDADAVYGAYGVGVCGAYSAYEVSGHPRRPQTLRIGIHVPPFACVAVTQRKKYGQMTGIIFVYANGGISYSPEARAQSAQNIAYCRPVAGV